MLPALINAVGAVRFYKQSEKMLELIDVIVILCNSEISAVGVIVASEVLLGLERVVTLSMEYSPCSKIVGSLPRISCR